MWDSRAKRPSACRPTSAAQPSSSVDGRRRARKCRTACPSTTRRVALSPLTRHCRSSKVNSARETGVVDDVPRRDVANVEIRVSSSIIDDAGRNDHAHSSAIGRSELADKRTNSGPKVDPLESRRNLWNTRDERGAAVVAPTCDHVRRLQAGRGTQTPARQVHYLPGAIGVLAEEKPTVQGQRGADQPFWRYGLRQSIEALLVASRSTAWFTAARQDALAVREPRAHG